MEVIRRICIVVIWGTCLWIWVQAGLPADDVPFMWNVAGAGVLILSGGAAHLIITWICAGAKKKAPENRGPREPEL